MREIIKEHMENVWGRVLLIAVLVLSLSFVLLILLAIYLLTSQYM